MALFNSSRIQTGLFSKKAWSFVNPVPRYSAIAFLFLVVVETWISLAPAPRQASRRASQEHPQFPCV